MKNGTKKLFPTDYKRFAETMIQAAEEGELPVLLELSDPERFTLKDFADMFTDFCDDTGLDITGHFYVCDKCDKLHVHIEVDYTEDDEEPTLLQ